MRLDQDAQVRLNRAKNIIGDKPEKIEEALKAVLCDVHDRARRIYLRNDLGRRLRRSLAKLRTLHKKNT